MPENLYASNTAPVQHTAKGLLSRPSAPTAYDKTMPQCILSGAAVHKVVAAGPARATSGKWHLAAASPQGDTWVRKSAVYPHAAPLRSSIRKPRAGQAQFCPVEDDNSCEFATMSSRPQLAVSTSMIPRRKVCAGCDTIITGTVFLLNDRTYCSEQHRHRAFSDLQWDGEENRLVARCSRGLREPVSKTAGATISSGHGPLPHQTLHMIGSVEEAAGNKGGKHTGRSVLASIFAWRS